MNRKFLGVVGILFVGIAVGLAVNSFSSFSLTGLFALDGTPSSLESLYELVNPGIDVEVVKTDDVSGMYKVLFKATDVAGAVSYREAYLSKDGKLLTESMIMVEESIGQLTKIRDFVDCLDGKSLKIAGVSNHTATLVQFNALGGSYATKLYLSCDGELAQQCVNAGITQVPSVIYNNQGYAGAQSIQFFENLTGCKF